MTTPNIDGRLSYADGLRLGLPGNPHPGQAMRDTASGVVYVWIEDRNMGDLGFWGALIGAVAGPLLGMFSGGPKPDNAARQQLQQQQAQMAGLQSQIDEQSFFQPKNIFLVGVMGLALIMAFRK